MQQQNGHRSLEPPSPWDILYRSLHRIEDTQRETVSRLGGLETGQRLTLGALETAFKRVGKVEGRVAKIESSASRSPPDSSSGSTMLGLLTQMAIPPLLRSVLVALFLAAAGLGIIPADRLAAIQGALSITGK